MKRSTLKRLVREALRNTSIEHKTLEYTFTENSAVIKIKDCQNLTSFNYVGTSSEKEMFHALFDKFIKYIPDLDMNHRLVSTRRGVNQTLICTIQIHFEEVVQERKDLNISMLGIQGAL